MDAAATKKPEYLILSTLSLCNLSLNIERSEENDRGSEVIVGDDYESDQTYTRYSW